VKARIQDHAGVEAVTVDEVPGYWVVRGAVPAREGIIPGHAILHDGTTLQGAGFQTWAEIRKAAPSMNGVPLILNHRRDGEDSLVLGEVRDARADDERRRIVADAWLYREPIDGRMVDASAFAENARLVERIRRGEPVDVSPEADALLLRVPGQFAGQAYTHERRDIVYDAVAVLPNGRGACPPPHCALGATKDMNPDPKKDADDAKARLEDERWTTRISDALALSLKRAFPRLATPTPAPGRTGDEEQPSGGTRVDEKELKEAQEVCQTLGKTLDTQATPASILARVNTLKTEAATTKDQLVKAETKAKALEEQLGKVKDAEAKELERLVTDVAKHYPDPVQQATIRGLTLDELRAVHAKLPTPRGAPSLTRDELKAQTKDGYMVTEDGILLTVAMPEKPKGVWQ